MRPLNHEPDSSDPPSHPPDLWTQDTHERETHWEPEPPIGPGTPRPVRTRGAGTPKEPQVPQDATRPRVLTRGPGTRPWWPDPEIDQTRVTGGT